jgi:hypothetical protein
MGVIMSMVKALKEFVMKKEKEETHTLFGRQIGPRISFTEVVHTPEINRLRLILREDDEINRVHKHHDEWAERIKRTCVGDDLQTRLAEVEDFRQRRLQAAPAVVKRRAGKIQRQAEEKRIRPRWQNIWLNVSMRGIGSGKNYVNTQTLNEMRCTERKEMRSESQHHPK